ncbi:MAG: hypothetical protein GX320_09195 [Tissierellia bacterium]|nr:hypothetical protein [Tissierellia bacterium]
MKYVSMVDHYDGSTLEEQVNGWIVENQDILSEIMDIEYTQIGNTYLATITYQEKE